MSADIYREFSIPSMRDHENGPTSAEMAMAQEITRLRAENARLRAESRERIATAALSGLLAHRKQMSPAETVHYAIELADGMVICLSREVATEEDRTP